MSFQGLWTRNADLVLATLLTVGGVYFLSGRFTTVRFDREQIEVELQTSRISVRGLYHYTNSSALPAVLTLQVPFPVDAHHPEPEWYTLYESNADGRADTTLNPIVRGNAVYFRLLFRPREGKWIRLDYEQRAESPNGRYLLTTTRAWGRPIGRADFVLRMLPGLELTSSTYPLQPEPGSGPSRTYTFSRTDFYPDRDWVFRWAELPAHSANTPRRVP